MNERDLFIAVLQKDDPAERAALLDRACADAPALRQRVERLLGAYDGAGSFLEPPARAGSPTTAEPAPELPGTDIGPYKLLQQIGEGGMGTVYMAEQQQPVRRTVALKIIKAGMDSAQIIARFEAERQALALMDHPNIAKVLDAATTDGGRPYFVMELVKGIPITKFCDEHQLTPRERLELFLPVCHAIQHAHQKGIIHRDLKPSNVLVAQYDDKPVPKVIDFGVAKATSQRLTERTMFTAFGSLVGTLEYMSPEQAKLNALDIDTRSDVYALGVLLYELLTGSTPLERARLRDAALDELLRQIREEDPPKPSTRLSQSGAALAAICARRRTEPAKLGKVVRGELDWIVMRALEKDRIRRYETASGLARDIQRYLADEPVEACPPSAGYRLQKLARRYKKPLAIVAVFVALLLGGVLVSGWQAIRASGERDRALAAEAKATAEKETTQAALGFLWQDFPSQASPLLGPDRELKLRTLLDRVSSRLERGSGKPPLVEASIRQMLGEMYFYLADGLKAQEHLDWALAVQRRELGEEDPQTLATMHVLARCLFQRAAQSGGSVEPAREAARLIERTLDLRRRVLGDDHRDTITSMRMAAGVGLARLWLRAPEEESRRRFEVGERLLEEAVARSARTYGESDRDTLWATVQLAQYLTVRGGRLDRAEELLIRCLDHCRAFGDDDLLTLLVKERLYFVSYLRNDLARAQRLGEDVVAGSRRVLGDRNILTHRFLVNLADLYQRQGRWAEAVPLIDELEAADSAFVTEFRGRHLRAEQKFAEAEQWLRQFLAQARPGEEASRAQCELGDCLLAQKKYAEAEPLLVQGYESMRKSADRRGMTPNQRLRLAEALGWLVQPYDEWGKPAEAVKWRKELEVAKTR